MSLNDQFAESFPILHSVQGQMVLPLAQFVWMVNGSSFAISSQIERETMLGGLFLNKASLANDRNSKRVCLLFASVARTHLTHILIRI